jgi:anaerobic selenocysteine-containing dehydrogenase
MEGTKRIGTCSKDCPGGCVFEGYWNDTAPEHKFINAIPMNGHPFTQGVFCSKLQRRQDAIYHEKRLKQPLIRTGVKGSNEFTPISLDVALTQLARKMESIQLLYGHAAILGAYYSGNSHLISQFSPLRFFNAIRGTITTGGICNEGGIAGLKQLFGTYSLTNPFQLADPSTKLILVWGSNLTDTNNHAYFLTKKALRNGAFLVVIDSRRTQIAREAHYFLQIYPGTEHLIVLLLLKYLLRKNALDTAFIEKNVEGYPNILQQLSKFDEDDLLRKLDIPSKSIEEIGDLLIQYRHHTIFSIGTGVQKDYFGGQIIQNIALLQILLGNLGKPGTGILFSQSDFNHQFNDPVLNYISRNNPDRPIPTINLIELASQLHSGKYKMLFIWNFNPADSLPNQTLVQKALAREDIYLVVLDLFQNNTTKFADLIIPMKFDVESDDLNAAYYIPGISLNEGGPCPYPECNSNWEFFRLLAKKLNLSSERFQESQSDIQKACISLLPQEMKNDLSAKGYSILFKADSIPFQDSSYPTSTKKIQLAPISFNFGQAELERKLERKNDEYMLITPSHPQLLHSQLTEIHPETLSFADKIFISPKDLHASGLEVGELVEVSNDSYRTDYIISVSTQLKPGVAMIYKGLSTTEPVYRNANYFTPDRPEVLGKSGSYNAGLIRIKAKKTQL